MGLDSHSGVLGLRKALQERGFEPEVVELVRLTGARVVAVG